MVASLVEDAFRYVARPKLIAQLDAPVRAPPAPRRKTRAR
jgi:hypothetical protein